MNSPWVYIKETIYNNLYTYFTFYPEESHNFELTDKNLASKRDTLLASLFANVWWVLSRRPVHLNVFYCMRVFTLNVIGFFSVITFNLTTYLVSFIPYKNKFIHTLFIYPLIQSTIHFFQHLLLCAVFVVFICCVALCCVVFGFLSSSEFVSLKD